MITCPANTNALYQLLSSLYLSAGCCGGTSSPQRFRRWSPAAWQRQPTLNSRFYSYNASSDPPKLIWQTWKTSPAEEGFDSRFRPANVSWHTVSPEFRHEVITDTAAVDLVHQLFDGVPAVFEAYDALLGPVLKADFFRYLILLAHGGAYSDIDTTALKPIASWVPADLEPFGLRVGIEADSDRPDWQDWYARRLQFCQWTNMSKPGHPVLVDIVASITEETLKLKERNELRPAFIKTVMEFTGVGIWTDSIFSHFKIPQWQDDNTTSSSSSDTWRVFVSLKEPAKVWDVLVLPITIFSLLVLATWVLGRLRTV